MSFSAGKNLQTNINTTEAQTLSNKTLDNTNAINGAPVQDSELSNVSITSPSKLQMKQYADLATAQADLANRSGGELVYVADIKKTYQVNDDGLGTKTLAEISGGQGGVNYIENSDFEQGVDGYTDDVNFTIAQTKVAGEILRGEASAKLSKAAVDASNEEISVPFTVSRADLAKKLTVSFEYDASDVNYADDDIQVYVKQDPNGTPSVIRINGEDLKGGKGTHYAQFQTDASQTEYELVFKVNSANASAYDVIIDDVKVGPRELAKGTIVTDFIDFSLDASLSNAGNAVIELANWKRVGDEAVVSIRIGMGSVAPTGNIIFNLPSYLTIDTSKSNEFGQFCSAYDGGLVHTGSIVILNSTSIGFRGDDGVSNWNTTTPITWTSGDRINCTIRIPIQGWSSNAVMSEDLGGREAIFSALTNSIFPKTFLSGDNIIQLNINSQIDTLNGRSGDSYVIQKSGYYSISGSVTLGGTVTTFYSYITVNNSDQIIRGNRATTDGNGSNIYASLVPKKTYKLEKGDTVRLVANLSSGVSLNQYGRGFLDIQEVTSPQTILESETVAARYTSSNAQGFDRGSNIPIIFENLDYDTHNTYDTETGVYTTAVSGIYSVKANVTFPGGELVDDSGRLGLSIRINGAAVAFREYTINKIVTRQSFHLSSDIQLNKGDSMTITLFHDNGTSSNEINLSPDNAQNYLTIHKIK